MKKYFLFFTILLAKTYAYAAPIAQGPDPILPPYTASYVINYDNKPVGTTTKTLSYPQPGYYSFTANTTIQTFLIHQLYAETSQGFSGLGFKPQLYKLISNGKITYQTNSIPMGTQDNLSQELTLRYFLLAKKLPKTISLITAKGLEVYTFKIVQSNEIVNTLFAGPISTVHIQFFDRENNQVDEWLAVKYKYLPVAINIGKNNRISSTIYLKSIY